MSQELGNPNELETEAVTPETETEEETSTPTVEELQKQIELMNKRLSDKDRYITDIKKDVSRTASLEAELASLKARVDVNKSSYAPEEVDAIYQIKQKEEELASVKMDAQRRTNQSTIYSKFSNFEELKPEISNILREQGFDDAAIRAFETDPYQYTPESISMYAENAKYRLQNKKLENMSNTVLDNIERSANLGTITNSTGMGGRSNTSSNYDLNVLESWTQEEIDAELRKLGR